ncbi:MAG: disulfide bond formation protein B [Rickettsiaceae bacterium]
MNMSIICNRMENLIKIFSESNFIRLFIFFTAYCVCAMTFAYYVQYVMVLEPCTLCVYQRIPYIIILILSIIGLMFSTKRYCILILILIMLASSVLVAGYHSAIENHWIEATERCQSNFQQFSNTKSLAKNLANFHQQNIVDCSKPALVILWLSMTEWNFIMNLTVLVFVLIILLSRKHYAQTTISK